MKPSDSSSVMHPCTEEHGLVKYRVNRKREWN